jgi:PAS domain S-box-containing protein
MEDPEVLKRMLERERAARKAAEKTLEEKSLEIFRMNEELRGLNVILEDLINVKNKEMANMAKMTMENPDPLLRLDFHGMVMQQNPVASKITRIKFEGITYTSVEFWRYFSQTDKVNSGDPIEVLGNEKVYSFSFVPNRESGYINVYGRDISDRRTTATRLENLIENLQVGVLVEDEDRRIVLANEMFCSLFGLDAEPEDMIGQDCSSYADMSKDYFVDPMGFVSDIDLLLENKELVVGQELELTDGRFFERDFIPLFVEGEYKGTMWKYRDVSLRKASEKDLKYSEEKYRSIIRNMNLGLIEVDTKERILYANQSFCEMAGYQQQELIGHNPSELFLTNDNKHVMIEKNILRQQGVSDAYEVNVELRNGDLRWWLVSGAPLYSNDGELIGSIGIHLDITKQKELEYNLTTARQQALASATAKEIFLTNMSHELRTPLNGIMGIVRELRRTASDNVMKGHLESIHFAADHLLNILNDILDLSRIDAGKLTMDNTGFKVEDVIQRSIEVNKLRAEEKGLQLKGEVSEEVSKILVGDPIRVRQILINLIGNAIKFTDNGYVSIRCYVKQSLANRQWITLEVEDTGIGMEESFVDNIFSKFTQEDSSIKRNYGGAGLGLNITKQLTELMKGVISVESKKGRGSKFIVSIPFKIGDESDLPVELTISPENLNLENIKVLLVEDNPLNQEVAKLTLKHLKTKVDVVGDGAAAIEKLRLVSYDIVLMDLQMPVLDGYAATKIIRDELKLMVPIIALTANAIKGEREKCLNAGMDDFVSKPFEEKDIAKVLVKHVLDKRREPGTEKVKALYDLTRLIQLSNGDMSFVKKMVTMFIKQTEDFNKEFTEIQKVKDIAMLNKLSHKMKPAIDNLGIVSLATLIRELEKWELSSDDEWNILHKKVEDVKNILKQVAIELHKEI